MKRITLLGMTLASLFLFGACASQPEPAKAPEPAPAAAPPPAKEDVAAEITKLENEWVASIEKKDVEALKALLADDFAGTSATGATYPKESAIEDLQKGAYVVESMKMDEVTVNVYGDTAVSFTSQQEKSKYDGKDNSGHYHFTNVWVKRNGKWQVVASHGSRYGK